MRLVEPMVLYWYGRAMIEASVTNFRALEMVVHAKLAEEFLRE